MPNPRRLRKWPPSLVMLVGPMTGLPDANRPAFNLAAEVLGAFGVEVINPARHPDGWPRSEYMRHSTADVHRVALAGGAVVRLDGWKGADGARFEVGLAMRLAVSVLDFTPLVAAVFRRDMLRSTRMIYRPCLWDFHEPRRAIAGRVLRHAVLVQAPAGGFDGARVTGTWDVDVVEPHGVAYRVRMPLMTTRRDAERMALARTRRGD